MMMIMMMMMLMMIIIILISTGIILEFDHLLSPLGTDPNKHTHIATEQNEDHA